MFVIKRLVSMHDNFSTPKHLVLPGMRCFQRRFTAAMIRGHHRKRRTSGTLISETGSLRGNQQLEAVVFTAQDSILQRLQHYKLQLDVLSVGLTAMKKLR